MRLGPTPPLLPSTARRKDLASGERSGPNPRCPRVIIEDLAEHAVARVEQVERGTPPGPDRGDRGPMPLRTRRTGPGCEDPIRGHAGSAAARRPSSNARQEHAHAVAVPTPGELARCARCPWLRAVASEPVEPTRSSDSRRLRVHGSYPLEPLPTSRARELVQRQSARTPTSRAIRSRAAVRRGLT